jgi:hypothetical protein
MTPTEVSAGGNTWQVLRGAFRGARQPALDVTVTVPATFPAPRAGLGTGQGRAGLRRADPGATLLAAAVRAAVAQVVAEHAAALGVPARPAVTVTFRTGESPQLVLAGRRARIVAADLDEALAAQGLPADWQHGDDEDEMAAAVATACRVAIEHDPSVLVGPQQRDALLARARSAGLNEHGDILAAALEQVIAYGMRVNDLGRLRAALAEQTGLVRTASELAEVAMGALGEPSIGITVHEHTLRAATLSIPQPREFIELRKRLFNDLGVAFPDIEVKTDSAVPEQAAVVRLNHLRHAPRPLPDGACLADIAAVLEGRLRAHPSWFVSLAEVHRTIEEMKLALPDLVSSVLDRYSEPQLCLFGRTFVAEKLPVRNVARLMILLLDVPPPVAGHDLVRLAEPSRRGDEQAGRSTPGTLVSYTRQQMHEEAVRAQPGLVVVERTRLPGDLDTAFSAIPFSPARVEDDVRPADLRLLTSLAENQLSEDQPTLVGATQSSRGVARRLLVRQYPEVAVIAAEEFPPSYQLQPVGQERQPMSSPDVPTVPGDTEGGHRP